MSLIQEINTEGIKCGAVSENDSLIYGLDCYLKMDIFKWSGT